MLLRLTIENGETPYLIVLSGYVTVTAPILRYMMGWTLARVEEYAAGCGWRVEKIGG